MKTNSSVTGSSSPLSLREKAGVRVFRSILVSCSTALLINCAIPALAQPAPPPPVFKTKPADKTAPAAATAAITVAPQSMSGVGLPDGIYVLDQFGPVKTRQEAQDTYAAAQDAILAAGGGILLISKETDPGFTPQSPRQDQIRIPAAPAPAKNWKAGPGITLIDLRNAGAIMPPMTSGLQFQRQLLLPEGQSLPHWNYQPMIWLNNTILRGSNSYRDWVQLDAPGGKDTKIYVATIRGIFPGEFLNLEAGKVERLYVKSLGYDSQRKLWYFLTDTDGPVKKGHILSNKNHVNLVRMDTWSHNENQTFDIMIWRHNYSQGDNYLLDARFYYMGDVHSTAGDENGVIYAGFIESDTKPFTGKVDSFDAGSQTLIYASGANAANTLGSGRPIINLNPLKQIKQGSVRIVRPASWWDNEAPSSGDGVYLGKTYPTTVAPNAIGQTALKMGGLIRASADAPISANHAGWYFAVTEPGEAIPDSGQLRWYLIHSVTINPDNTKDIQIVRHWWGAKPAGSPTLYKDSNYTSDGHDKPLKFVIAPGANAYDVSEGVANTAAGYTSTKRTIKLAPGPFAATPNDFEKGDPVVQAVGPDPFRPITLRSWLFESVPGAFPAPVIDIANHGHIARATVMTVAGGPVTFPDAAKRYDGKPAWENIFVFDSAANNGIVFRGDVTTGILFHQPTTETPIVWKYGKEKEAKLSVSRDTGTFNIQGNGLQINGGAFNVAGLSGSQTPSKNLRGVSIPVPAGQTKLTVKFPRAEPDAKYAIFLELSWLTVRAITQQTPDGFTVEFEKAPGKDATLHWMLVR
jgi:hypothetical protein